MAEIGVLIAAYIQSGDQIKWLSEALDSLRVQTFRDFEIIVVDDASPAWDRPADVKVLRNDTRRGPGASRNIAAQATRAPWLIALDADDMLLPDALEKLYAARCEYEIAYGDMEWAGERTGYALLHEYNPDHLKAFTGPMPVTALHSRKAWRSVGGWTESLQGLEDIEYWIKLAEIGVCGKRIPATTLRYRVHADSRTASLRSDDHRLWGDVTREIKEKHRPFFGGIMATCATCPGAGANGSDSQLGAAPPGMVELKYVGLMQGGFHTAAGISRQSYRVEGRGSHLHVHAADVPFLVSLQGANGPEYIVVERGQPPLAPQLFAAQTAESDIAAPAPAAAPVIFDKNVKELSLIIAEAHDVMDLRIWLAEEQSSATPRKTVLKAIEVRLEQLLGAA